MTMDRVKEENIGVKCEGEGNVDTENADFVEYLTGASPMTKRFYDQKFGSDREKVEKCKNLLLEIKNVNPVLLQKLPFAIQFNKTFESIREVAEDLPALNVELPMHLACINEDYKWFEEHKSDDMYKDHKEAIEELEEIVRVSTSKIKEVIKELKTKCKDFTLVIIQKTI